MRRTDCQEEDQTLVHIDADDVGVSVVDVISAMTRKSANEAAEQLRRLIERYPDVKANCFDVKFPKGKSEKRVKRGGRREIGDRISRSLDVCGP